MGQDVGKQETSMGKRLSDARSNRTSAQRPNGRKSVPGTTAIFRNWPRPLEIVCQRLNALASMSIVPDDQQARNSACPASNAQIVAGV